MSRSNQSILPNRKWLVTGSLGLVLTLVGAYQGTANSESSPAPGAAQNHKADKPNTPAVQPSIDAKAALEHWAKVHEVFSHPRCANCHVPADNRPRWSGPNYGDKWRYHAMNIDAGPADKPGGIRDGAHTLPCTTCHTQKNSPMPHGPPGAEIWALAPLEMQWWDKSSAEICAQIQDPARNGQRSLEEIAHHVEHDHLVAWAWHPGPGRQPAPYSAKEIAQSIRAWAAAGAPCP